jgi:hypothetical protein
MALFARRPTRVNAALIHLASSALVASGVAALMFGVWYPGPFRHLAGGVTLFFIIASVDVVLGPLLTLVVFNPDKRRRELTIDLGLILLVQVSALAYGVWTMAAARPVYLAFEIDLFRVVTAADVDDDQLSSAPQALRTLPWRGPALVGTARPSADQQVEATVLGMSGIHLAMQPRYWVAYESQRGQAWASGQPLSKLPPELRRRLPGEVLYWPGDKTPALDGLRWLPVMSSRARWTVFVDAAGMPVAFAPFDAP